MAQAAAGSLYIDIIANVARLQSDMNAMKRAVGDATGVVSASLDKARGSTERYLAALEAEAAKLGKTSSEIKKMEIAANAAAAEAQGFNELAASIRTAGAALEKAQADQLAAAAAEKRAAEAAREAAAAQALAAREQEQARSSAEQYVAALDREAASLGKTTTEIRQMEVASRAAAAEAAGFTELAQQIRASGAALQQAQADHAALSAREMEAAQAARQAATAEKEYATSLANLRAQLNPLAAEEERLAGMINIANQAFARGDMGTQEYIGTITTLEKRMEGVRRAGGQVTTSLGAQRAGWQQLGMNVGDVGASVASGGRIMTIFAQQAGQMAQAVSLIAGESKGLIGFIGGPWMQVIIAAVAILGVFIGKSMESESATKDLTSALDVQKLGTYELIAAIKKKIEADEQSIKSDYAREVSAYDVARALQTQTMRELQLAKSRLTAAQQQTFGAGGASGAGMTTAVFASQVAQLDKALADASKDVRAKYIPIIKRELTAAHDAAAAAALRNDKAEAKLTASFYAGSIGGEEYRRQMDRLTAQRVADQAATRGSANSLIDAQARMEASTTHLSEAQAHLALVKAQAARIKDPTSPAAIKLQEELAGAYRDVASAQQAAIDDRKAASAAAAAAHHAQALARDASAMDATAQSGFELARAYLGATDATVEANDADRRDRQHPGCRSDRRGAAPRRLGGDEEGHRRGSADAPRAGEHDRGRLGAGGQDRLPAPHRDLDARRPQRAAGGRQDQPRRI
jgi:hypothetical protein